MRITREFLPLLIFRNKTAFIGCFALVFALLIGICRVTAAPAQILQTERTEVLPLERAIAMALTNNLDVRWNRTDLKIDTDRIRYAWGVFDPSLNLSALRESNRTTQIVQSQTSLLTRNDVNAVFSGTTPQSEVVGLGENQSAQLQINSQENDHYQSALDGKTPLGTHYNLGLRADRLTDTYRYGVSQDAANKVFSPEYDSFAGLTINQPLLRDFGPTANMAEIRIARKTKEITELTWEGKIITAIESVLTTYYEMQLGVALIEVREQAIEVDKRYVRENQRRMEVGMMSPNDVRQAEVALSTDQEALLAAKNFFMERQFQLKRQILSAVDSDNEAVFIPAGTLKDAPESKSPSDLNRAKLLSDAFENRLDYKQAVKEAEIQNIRLKYAKNQLWPRLDLIGTYGYNGLQDNFRNSFSNAFTTKTPSWSVGLQASIPIGNVQGRSQYAIVKSLKEQSILKIKQTELNTSLDVETMISRIQTNIQSVETSRQTRRLAEETMRIQDKQIEQGLISVFDALETKKKLFDACAREVSALADLNKAYVLLDVATGTLLKKHAISVVE